jgi:hypothetical protein
MYFSTHDPKQAEKIQKAIYKSEKELFKAQKKMDVSRYVNACLERAVNHFRLYQKKEGFTAIAYAKEFCLRNPNAKTRSWPYEMIPNSDALYKDVEGMEAFFSDFFSDYEWMLESGQIRYQSYCLVGQPQEDKEFKKGTIIPIPFVGAFKIVRSYAGLFTHVGGIFLTDSGLYFILAPAVVNVNSIGFTSYQQQVNFHCVLPKMFSFRIKWEDVRKHSLDDHAVPKFPTNRIETDRGPVDIMIFNNEYLNVLKMQIRDNKELNLPHLCFRYILASAIYKDRNAQKQFSDVLMNSYRGGRKFAPP